MGHWLFQSQQEWRKGAAGSPRSTQTHGRSIIHGSPWACSEHWHPTCLNQTGPVSLMPLGKCEAQVKVGWWGVGGGDCYDQIRKDKREGLRGNEGIAPVLHWLFLERCRQSSFKISLSWFPSLFLPFFSGHFNFDMIFLLLYCALSKNTKTLHCRKEMLGMCIRVQS